MTEKQKALLRFLPECNNNLSKAAEKAGYSESYAKKRIHNYVGHCRKPLLETEESVKKRYVNETRKLKKRFLKQGDNSNAARMHEAEGRTKGLFKDKLETTGNASNVVISYGQGSKAETLSKLSLKQEDGSNSVLEGKEAIVEGDVKREIKKEVGIDKGSGGAPPNSDG